jgi:heptosyltransferase-2
VAHLVIQTSFLGDVVLTTPLLHALAADAPVDVVTTPQAAPLLDGHPAVRRIIIYDKRGADRGVGALLKRARQLRAEHYDAAYLAQGSVRSGALAWAARIPRRVGFDRSAGSRWYTERVSYDPATHHAARLLSLAGVTASEPLRPSLAPSSSARQAAAALLAACTSTDRRPLIALAPGSVWATKRWAYFPELAAALAPTARLLLIGGPDDRPLADAMVAQAGPDALLVDAVGRVPLPVSAALIGAADAIVSNDSLPLHLASAMGTPTVAIFGPTVPAMGFGPLAPRAAIVEHESLSCRPCHAHGPMRCPLAHFRCMRDTPVARVLSALFAVGVPLPG